MLTRCAYPDDVLIFAGNDYPPARWQFLASEDPDVPFPIEGSDFYLTIVWGNQSINLNTIQNSADLVIDPSISMLTWHYTIEQSRLLPKGRIARYELERRIMDTQQDWIAGRIVVDLGDNADGAVLAVASLTDDQGSILVDWYDSELTE